MAGYLELGRRCAFRYPWPIVAILGIVQVMAGMERARLCGVVGRWASRLGYERLERLGDASEDVLRRTNRGIFADSVPTVLRALRAERLRGEGKTALAEALLDGHAAVLWDEESARLCRMIADGLAIADEARRFRALADATLRHFAREQAIFTHHIGSRPGHRRVRAMRSIPAPVIERGELVFRPYRLPPAFDLQDHAARVDAFGRAFVASITGSIDDYRIATDWVLERFGAPDRSVAVPETRVHSGLTRAASFLYEVTRCIGLSSRSSVAPGSEPAAGPPRGRAPAPAPSRVDPRRT